MTQAKGGIFSAPTDPTEVVIKNVVQPGRLDVTKEAMGLSSVSGAGIRNAGRSVTDWSASSGALSLSSVNGTGEAVTLDASNPFNGKPSILCKMPTGAALDFEARLVLGTPLYLGKFDTIQVPISVSINTTQSVIAQIRLQLSSGKQLRYPVNLANYQPGKFHVISFSRGSTPGLGGGATGIADFDSELVTEVRVRVTTDATTAGTNLISVGEIRAGAKSMPRCIISADGVYAEQASYLLPLLDKYGFKASFAVTVAQIGSGGRMTNAQLDAAYANGHELIMHSNSANTSVGWGDLGKFPTAQSITDEVTSVWDYFRARGWTRGIGHGVHGYTYGWAATVPTSRQLELGAALVSGGMLSCRRGDTPDARYQNFVQPGFDWLSLAGTRLITSTDTGATMNAVLATTIANGELYYPTFHRLVLDSATPGSLEMKISEADIFLANLADQVRQGKVRVTPQGQAYQEVTTGLFA